MFAPRAVRKPAVAKPKAQPQPQAKRPLDPAATTSASGEEPKKKRKSRWGSANSTAGLAEPRKGDPLFAGLAPSTTFVPKAATSTAVPQTTLQQVPEVVSASPPTGSSDSSAKTAANGHSDAKETTPDADSTEGAEPIPFQSRSCAPLVCRPQTSYHSRARRAPQVLAQISPDRHLQHHKVNRSQMPMVLARTRHRSEEKMHRAASARAPRRRQSNMSRSNR
jgi:hypothetical protein